RRWWWRRRGRRRWRRWRWRWWGRACRNRVGLVGTRARGEERVPGERGANEFRSGREERRGSVHVSRRIREVAPDRRPRDPDILADLQVDVFAGDAGLRVRPPKHGHDCDGPPWCGRIGQVAFDAAARE